MDLEDLSPPLEIGEVDFNEAVESARPSEGGIQDFFLVGCGEDDDVGVRIESIHLHEQLVQSSVSFVIAASAHPRPLLPHSVDLINEDDRRRTFLGLFEEVSHTLRTDTDVHLDELATADGEEGHFALSRAGLGDHRLAGAWRTSQQCTFRDPSA